MKKILVMSALVAFSTAFVACSNENDLVQQKPDVPEDMIEEGIPMKIIVSDLATRGTDFSSTNPLLAFKLYSTMLTPAEAAQATPPETPSWTKGKALTRDDGDSDWTTNGVLAWPDEAEHTFFAINVAEDTEFADIAENSGAGDGHPDLPVVTATTCSFNYKMPISVKPKADPGDADEYYYNSEDLKDLLVATTTGSSTTGDPAGSLTINFTHALAQITAIKVYCSSDKMEKVSGYDPDEDIPCWHFRIGGDCIRIGGLKAVGTYTFGASTPWVVSGDDEEFEISLDKTKQTFDKAFTPSLRTDAKEISLTDGGFYLIPQAVAGSVMKTTEGYNVVGPYVELYAQICRFLDPSDPTDVVWEYAGDETSPVDWTEADSNKALYKKIRVPLKFDISATGAGPTISSRTPPR